MNIQHIKESLIAGLNLTYRAVKSSVTWGGHRIQVGFNHYLAPTIKSLWNSSQPGLIKIAEFLKTNSGMAFAAAVSLLLVGNQLIRLSQSDEYQEDLLTRTSLTLAGLTAVAGAVIATGIGVSTKGVV